MPKIWTLGPDHKKTQFTYSGDVINGVTLMFSGNPKITSKFFDAILQHFKESTIAGGFSMTAPTPGGLGEWVANNAKKLNGTTLTPRHASFIAAILVHEKFLKSSLRGNAVYLHF